MGWIAKKRAFTLIESLTVVAIVSILAGLTVFAITQAQRQARDAKRKSDLVVIANAFELRFQDRSCVNALNIYPGNNLSKTVGENPKFRWLTVEEIHNDADSDRCNRPFSFYLSQVPNDPLAGRPYLFNLSSASPDSKTEVDAGRFRLAARLERTLSVSELSECTRQSEIWVNDFNGMPFDCSAQNNSSLPSKRFRNISFITPANALPFCEMCQTCAELDGDSYQNCIRLRLECVRNNLRLGCISCLDADNDGHPEQTCDILPIDNCPNTPNPGQTDSNRDGIGDACQSSGNNNDGGGSGDDLAGIDSVKFYNYYIGR